MTQKRDTRGYMQEFKISPEKVDSNKKAYMNAAFPNFHKHISGKMRSAEFKSVA